jgi:hypothetical protein
MPDRHAWGCSYKSLQPISNKYQSLGPSLYFLLTRIFEVVITQRAGIIRQRYRLFIQSPDVLTLLFQFPIPLTWRRRGGYYVQSVLTLCLIRYGVFIPLSLNYHSWLLTHTAYLLPSVHRLDVGPWADSIHQAIIQIWEYVIAAMYEYKCYLRIKQSCGFI